MTDWDAIFDQLYHGGFSYFRKVRRNREPMFERYARRYVEQELERFAWLVEVQRKLEIGLDMAAKGQRIDWDNPPGKGSYVFVHGDDRPQGPQDA